MTTMPLFFTVVVRI